MLNWSVLRFDGDDKEQSKAFDGQNFDLSTTSVYSGCLRNVASVSIGRLSVRETPAGVIIRRSAIASTSHCFFVGCKIHVHEVQCDLFLQLDVLSLYAYRFVSQLTNKYT